MKNFEENFTSFQHEFTKVQQSRVSDYRSAIYQEMDEFFERIHSIVEEVRKQKQIEVEEVFRKLKIDDLSDLDKYKELRMNVERAMVDMQGHYRELAFSKIYMNKESIKKIDKAIVDISGHLRQSHAMYEEQWRHVIRIQRDDAVIENAISQFVDANFKALGSFAVPTKELNKELSSLVDGVSLDISVINKFNQNQVNMSQSEKQIVSNSVKGMYQGMKSLTLNYAQLTDYGAEILAETLALNRTVTKVDLSSNHITDLGMLHIGEMLSQNLAIESLKLGSNKLKDKSCDYLYEGLKNNEKVAQLHLEGNQFGNDGARFIAMLLLSNKTGLTHLYLDNNLIEDEGAEFIATALKSNQALQYLYLNNNRINYHGLHQLAQTLEKDNKTLKSLIVYNNLVTEEQAKENFKRLGGDRISVFNPLC